MASVVTLGAGEQIKDADIRLQQQFAPRHLSIGVTWADGTAIKQFVYIVTKGTANPALMCDASTGVRASDDGDVKILTNEPYEVQAKLTCRYADERSVGPGAALKSNTIYVNPDDGQAKLTLVIPAATPAIPGRTLVNDR